MNPKEKLVYALELFNFTDPVNYRSWTQSVHSSYEAAVEAGKSYFKIGHYSFRIQEYEIDEAPYSYRFWIWQYLDGEWRDINQPRKESQS